jgi:uncharacterized membrane protein HdeD (DUF308 family)
MPVASEYTRVSAWRRVSLVGGIMSIVLGVILLVWPRKTLLLVAALVGVWLLLFGSMRVVDALTGGHHVGAQPRTGTLRALAGGIYAITGIVILLDLHESVRFIAVLLGVLLICAGLGEALSGLVRLGGSWIRQAAIATGFLNVLIGLLVIVWPGISLPVLDGICAVWFFLLGLIQFYSSYVAGRAEREMRMRPGVQEGA